MPDEWSRTWRHEELVRDERMIRGLRCRRRERIERAVGDAMLVDAVVAMLWSIARAFA